MVEPSDLPRLLLTAAGVGWAVYTVRSRRGGRSGVTTDAHVLRARGLWTTLGSGFFLWLAMMFLPIWTWTFPSVGIAVGLVMGAIASYRIALADTRGTK